MNIREKISSVFGLQKRFGIRFMSFSGDCNTPGFHIRLDGLSGAREAYNQCSPVATIVNRLASSMANGQWWIVDEKNNDVSNRFPKVSALINNPNPLQTRTELIKQIDLYRNLYGVTYLYAVKPVGFNSIEDALALWPVNPERVTPKFKANVSFNVNTLEDIIEYYEIKIGNTVIKAPASDILCIRDASLDVLSETNWSSSRLRGLEHEIKNTVQAQEAIYALNKDRGAMGIITNKSKDASGFIPLNPEDKKQVQDEYQRIHGLSAHQAKVLITNWDLGWEPMSFNVKDLMLFEGIKQNIESISDAFNYPFELLANQKGSTFSNRAEAIKYLYQDNIIPASIIYAEKLTKFFGLKGAKIDIDFSGIEYLRQAEKEKAEALFKKNQALQIPYKLGVITLEEYRQLLDMDEKPKGGTFYEGDNKNKQS